MMIAALLPEARSVIADEVDSLYWFIHWLCVFFGLIIIVGTVILALKFKKKGKTGITPGIHHNTALEVFWTAVPTFLIFAIFIWGFLIYMHFAKAPEDAFEVRVRAWQWGWEFVYPTGKVSEDLVVPEGKPVKLLMNSNDVIHSLFIPDFRVKWDVIPNRYTSIWFEAKPLREGESQFESDIYCTEYCGKDHSRMNRRVRVITAKDFDTWVNDVPDRPGKLLVSANGYNCVSCHSLDGSENPAAGGPTWKDLYGKERQLTNGETVIADENYLLTSMNCPNCQVVKGFESVPMSNFSHLKEGEKQNIINYIMAFSEKGRAKLKAQGLDVDAILDGNPQEKPADEQAPEGAEKQAPEGDQEVKETEKTEESK